MSMFPPLRKLPVARGLQPGSVTPAAWNSVVAYCTALQKRVASLIPLSSPDIIVKKTANGFTCHLARRAAGGSGGASSACPFGKIVTTTEGETTTTAILGGIIHCGDQNWSMDNQELNLAASGTWLVSISVSLEVNRDDDGEILLPGVKTGTKPTGDWTKTVWTTGADYPDNTAPSASTGNGTVVLPIGKLTIADGAAKLEPAGCGNFTITHCAGTLGYSRA